MYLSKYICIDIFEKKLVGGGGGKMRGFKVLEG